jgi:aromatic-L-amino-acid decarboxylase
VTDGTKNSLSVELLNDLNKVFFRRISAREDLMLTPTVLNGFYCIRLAVGAARTEESHIQQAFELLTLEASVALEEWKMSKTLE